jgi:hypothetical protein
MIARMSLLVFSLLMASHGVRAEESGALASLESKVESLKQTALAPPAAAAQDLPYASVPEDKREQLVERIRLVAQILRKTGRAYDYRTLKTTELRRLHDQALESQKRAGS